MGRYTPLRTCGGYVAGALLRHKYERCAIDVPEDIHESAAGGREAAAQWRDSNVYQRAKTKDAVVT